MKTYKELKEQKETTLVMGFGRMNPFTTGHLLLVNKLLEEARKRKAEHKMYLSKSQDPKKNPLSIDKKIFWARKSAPGVNFVAADDNVRTFIEAVIAQSGKYDHLVMMAGSDRVANYKELLNKYNGKEFNFKSVDVVSAGERDPDAEGTSGMSATKLREAAANNNFTLFKSGVSPRLSDSDARKLMKDLRTGMGIKPVSESSFKITSERDQFYRGETFKIGQIVKEGDSKFEILDRGSNYVVVCNENGQIFRKFMTSLTIVEDLKIGYPESDSISFKGFVPSQYFTENPEVVAAFKDTISRYESGEIHDAVAILKAMQNTDQMLEHLHKIVDHADHPGEHAVVNGKVLEHYAKLRELLTNIGEFEHHIGYLQPLLSQVNYAEAEPGGMEESMEAPIVKPSDKMKVAKIIADALGVVHLQGNNAELLVNNALRLVKNKALKADSLVIIGNMLELAREVGIKFDENLVPQNLKEDEESADYKLDRRGRKRHKIIKIDHDAEDGDETVKEQHTFADDKSCEKKEAKGKQRRFTQVDGANNKTYPVAEETEEKTTFSKLLKQIKKKDEPEEHQKVGSTYSTSSETHRKQIVHKLMDH